MNEASPPPPVPNLDFLRTFVVFAEEGGFAAAGRRLALSQAAVHAQVRKLGDELERELYRRRGRGLELTEAGRETLAFARELLERCAVFMGARDRAPRLALGEGALLYVVSDAVRRAIAQDGPVDLRMAGAPAALRAVREGEVDVAVVAMAEAPADASFESVALRESHGVVVVPRGHELAERSRLSFAQLSQRPLVAPPEGAAQRVALEALAASAGIELKVAVQVRGWPATLHLVRIGAGIAVVNDVCRVGRGLVAIPLRGGPRVTYWLVRRRGGATAAALWARLLQARE